MKDRYIRYSTAALALAAAIFCACSVSMQQTMPGVRVEPELVAGKINKAGELLTTNKQIFKVRLLDKGSNFSGDGAMVFRAPDTLQLSIYGPPFSTLWMQMLTRGDSIVVVLPKEDRVVRASRSDPQPVTQLAGKGLTDAVFLGAVTGAFDIGRFRTGGTTEMATSGDGVSRLRLVDGESVYEFVFDEEWGAVTQFVHYRGGKKRREVIREEFQTLQSLPRARKMVYRDYDEDREITVLVRKEEVNPELSDEAFQLLLPDGR